MRPFRYLILALLPVMAGLLYECGHGHQNAEPRSTYINHADTVAYVGMQTCRTCHPDKYNTFIHTGMGQSFGRLSKQRSAAKYGPGYEVFDSILDFHYKPFWRDTSLFILEYRLRRGDTVHKRLEQVDYIIGSGQHTNSHLIDRGGYLYQAPITFYTQKDRWDLAPGFEGGYSSRFDREIGAECMSCHNGLPTMVLGSENKYSSIPFGIDCERCHGPGGEHVRRMSLGQQVDTATQTDWSIVNPAKLSLSRQLDLCQRCHLQGVAVLENGHTFLDYKPGMKLSDYWNVFLPKYEEGSTNFLMASQVDRLVQSRCFIESQGISCISCHNPHLTVKNTPSIQFNSVCLDCHNSTASCGISLERMTAANENCVSCHMPSSGSIDIPHVSITDHKIRIPHEGELEGDQFLKLTCLTDSQPSPLLKSRGYLRYYEGFVREASILDSARMWFDKSDSSEVQWFNTLIQLEFDKKHYPVVARQAAKRQITTIDAPWTAYRIGESYLQLGRTQQAGQWLQRALELMPLQPEFRNKLGSVFLLEGNFQAAEKTFSTLLAELPDYTPSLVNMGYLRASQARLSEAEEFYNHALALDPDYRQAIVNLCSLYMLTGRKAEAEELIRPLLEKRPDDVQLIQLAEQFGFL